MLKMKETTPSCLVLLKQFGFWERVEWSRVKIQATNPSTTGILIMIKGEKKSPRSVFNKKTSTNLVLWAVVAGRFAKSGFSIRLGHRNTWNNAHILEHSPE